MNILLLNGGKEFAMSTTETSTLLLAAFVARPLGGAILVVLPISMVVVWR